MKIINTSTKILAIVATCFMSFKVSAQNKNAIDNWMNDNLQNFGGRAVLIVYKNNKIVYQQSFNELRFKQKIAAKLFSKKLDNEVDLTNFKSNTQQRIASCSKWLTAALAMIFVDEKKLSLTDSIGKFLPVMTQYGKGKIEIWHCLSHLTGIHQINISDEIKDRNSIVPTWQTMDEAMESIAKENMEGEPGKTFHYGNVGLQIIAAILEKIEAKSFEKIFQEKIAIPLNMNNTHFGNKKVPLAAGGAFSTPLDYLNFLQMILNKGKFNGRQILTSKSIELMQTNYITKETKIVYTPKEAGNWGYGFGEWVINKASNQSSKAVTSPGLFGTFPWIDINKNYCAILFSFNLKSRGRNEKYTTLKKIIEENIE